MPWRPSANPQSTTRNGSHSARTENASGVSGMATRKPAKTLSPSRRRRRSKRTIDTSQVCPRSTWLTHVRSGFEQRAGERPSLASISSSTRSKYSLPPPRVIEVVVGPRRPTTAGLAQPRRRLRCSGGSHRWKPCLVGVGPCPRTRGTRSTRWSRNSPWRSVHLSPLHWVAASHCVPAMTRGMRRKRLVKLRPSRSAVSPQQVYHQASDQPTESTRPPAQNLTQPTQLA